MHLVDSSPLHNTAPKQAVTRTQLSPGASGAEVGKPCQVAWLPSLSASRESPGKCRGRCLSPHLPPQSLHWNPESSSTAALCI